MLEVVLRGVADGVLEEVLIIHQSLINNRSINQSINQTNKQTNPHAHNNWFIH